MPPTVVGYLLLRVLGPKRLIGAWVLETFGIRLVMTWWSAIFATVVVVFPLMYRTVRGAFEAFDETLAYAGQTLGLSNTYIFWHIRMPYCRQGVLAGAVLGSFSSLFEGKQVRDASFYMVYLLALALILKNFQSSGENLKAVITSLIAFMRILTPSYYLAAAAAR